MEYVLLLALAAMIVAFLVYWRTASAGRKERELGDARAEAQRWYERLGGQVMNLHGDEPAARQALADASERYNAAGGQLDQARTTTQFQLARETALEGLAYIRAARVSMGLDPGPDVPQLAAARGAGTLTKEREVSVQGQTFKAGPHSGPQTPYYYPGGRVNGRPVPQGWYSTPVWKTALATGAGVVGGMLIFDALFSPAFADPGMGGFDEGYADGYQEGLDDGGGYDDGGSGYDDGGGFDGGGDFGGGDFGGGDFGGDF